MRTGALVAAAVVLVVGAGAIYMVDIDQTRDGALPDVEVSGGQLPAYDADVGSIDMGTTESTVSVPDVDISVDTEERTVEMPTITVTPPEDDQG